MADWPPMKLVKPSQEKENMYLTLVDMFVDVVEPEIIQMVLQNRNWDLDGALEDIMILSSTPPSDKSLFKTNKPQTGLETVKMAYSKEAPGRSENMVYQNDNMASKTLTPLRELGVLAENSPPGMGKRNVKKPKPQTSVKSPQTVSDLKKSNQLNLLPFLDQFNYVKAITVPFDRAVMLIRDGVKLFVILRGPPGSGKSHLAKRLLKEAGIEPSANRKHIFSSDDFFVRNNVYVFVPDLLGQAHMWNQRNVATAVRDQVSPIIVDNTNTQAWEMRVYAEMAVSGGYDLEILEPDNWWFSKENELAKRNIHGVPKAKIRNMIERYERHITPNKLLQQFELRYSLSNAPPQPARYSKWKDKFGSQKSNKPKKKKSDRPQSVSQSSFGNLNSMFEPNLLGFSGVQQISSHRSSLPLPTEKSSTPCSYNSSNYSEGIVDPVQNNNLFSQMNGEHQFTKESSSSENSAFDYEITAHKSDSNCNMVESLTMNRRGTFQDSVPRFSQISNQTLSGYKVPHLNDTSLKYNSQENEAVGLKQEYTNPTTFDFMVESSKLLAALRKPSLSNENQKLNVPNEISPEPQPPFKQNEFINILGGKDCTTTSPSKEFTGLSELNQVCIDILKQSESLVEKVRNTKDLEDSVVEEVLCDGGEVDTKSKGASENEDLWDYVLVKNDTYIYKRLNSIPLSLEKDAPNDSSALTPKPCDSSSNMCYSGASKDCDCDELVKEETGCKESVTEESHSSVTAGSVEKIPSGDLIRADSKNEQVMDPNKELTGTSEMALMVNSQQETEKIDSFSNVGLDNISDFVDRDGSRCNSTNISEDKCALETGSVTEPSNKASADVLGMMKDILNTMAPLYENPFSTIKNDEHNIQGWTNPTDKHDLMSKPFESESNFSYAWDKRTVEITDHEKKPKPVRDLLRSRFSASTIATVQCQKESTPNSFGTWDTVSNPLDHWGVTDNEAKCLVTKEKDLVLPQRSKLSSKQVVDSSTNTNYQDFSLLNDVSPLGVKTLRGICRNIASDDYHNVRTDVSETLLLDKSTMTLANSLDSAKTFDINHISTLFPEIPEKYILDVVEKCQGDVNWAVDILLDSEHSIYSLVDDGLEDAPAIKDPDELQNLPAGIDKNSNPGKSSPKRESKSSYTHEQSELKRMIESSVVFGKSHYSDKILKVLKKKHPEYLNLIENNAVDLDDSTNKVTKEEISEQGVECMSPDELLESDVEEDKKSSSSSGCDVEDEDDTLDLIINNDLFFQLQQKFGNSNLPGMENMSPVVKLPVSLARQLYGYVMDSIQSEMDEQQNLIEGMIAQDEEIAKLLQFQDHQNGPQLQEIMDMEVALEVHRADQEEWKEKSNDTLAAKLSKNILLEKFPHVDPKMLMELLHAHNYSLHDTVASLNLVLGVEERKALQDWTPCPREDQSTEAWMTSVLVSEGRGASPDPVSEAQTHRDQAATYYSLRRDCLNKAHEAFRSGNKPVASYYSRLAVMHKDKVEMCNSRAAACLLATHKCGSNTLDLHFLHVTEAQTVLHLFLDEVIRHISDKKKKHQTVYLITGRGLRSVGGVSRIKPMVQRTLQSRGVEFAEVNPGMLSAVVRVTTALSSAA